MTAGRLILESLLIASIVLLPAGPYATTFPVTKTADTNDGTCDADCSLREAVVAANASAGADDITVPAGSYLLSIGPLTLTDDASVSGAGQSNTSVVRYFPGPFSNASRVLSVQYGVVAEVSGVTIQGSTEFEPGIFNDGTLTLADTTVSGNSGRGIDNYGSLTLLNTTVSGNFNGGILNYNATLTLTNSTVSGNTAFYAGGIYNNGMLTLINSTVSGNTGYVNGGIWNYGTLTLSSSTLSGNTSLTTAIYGDGGGLYNSGTATLTNSTVSGNTAVEVGGIDNNGSLDLRNSTVTGNTGSYLAGGLYTASSAYSNLENSIVAANSAPINANCQGSVNSAGYNLTDDASCGFSSAGDRVVADAKLGPLQDNGGPTETHAPLSDSPAIDTANNAVCAALDQRGAVRPIDGDGDGVTTCDIGAVERLPDNVVLDFETLAHAGTIVALSSYSEDGFTITSDANGSNLFGVFGTADSRFTGSAALFLSTWPATATLTNDHGNPFSLLAIDVSEFVDLPTFSNGLLTYKGTKVDGSSVMQSFFLDQNFGPETIFFSSEFSDLVAVSSFVDASGEQYHQFDNIVLEVTSDSLYWTDWNGFVKRAALDGSDAVTLVTSGSPSGLALDVAGGKLYWTDAGLDKVRRANLNGSNVEDLFTFDPFGNPRGIAVDPKNGKVYFSVTGDGGNIKRANLDGSSVENLVVGVLEVGGIGLDIGEGKMYWTELSYGNVRRANLDGTQVELLVAGQDRPSGIALDLSVGKIYWADAGFDNIQRANLDGSNVEQVVSGQDQIFGLALDLVRGVMYWADFFGPNELRRANLDGSGISTVISGVENLGGLSTNFDADSDALRDYDEWLIGTDPFDADSDNDGVADGTEVSVYGTDPLLADTDGDGLNDGAEVALGTDPLLPDHDGDGICDGGGTGGGACTAGPDNCPFVSNSGQTNSDAFSAGDACQCGDLNLDNVLDGADALLARQHVVGATILGTCDLRRCNVIGPADGGVSSDCNMVGSSDCNVADVYVLKRVAAALPVTLENTCQAYTGE